ncbi:peptidoglycan DD-metalloendopeptidase family protein [Sporosarcina luteola]|uniref:peptidoglycan DD-metalloendopeptidase family protein n=1 Tax=Sporosarcina luteola TaxID=582850 RepID=UPI00203B8E70|nr:peptidoglycan DD-metalloendopeptidase family protein [Sporosarcina luteola]MCM3638263.1 peptidoglycan DD-metalloendopeptidase family protein [Sporosarcina luteola]
MKKLLWLVPILASPGLLLLLSILALFLFLGVFIVFTEEDDERWNFAGGAVCRPDGEISEELFFSQFNNAGKFTEKGTVFIEVAEKYGIDPVLMAAIAFHETGSGTSAAVMLKNNPGGLMDPATGSRFLYSFSTIEEGIEAMGKTLHNRIIKDGLITIADLGSAYAPIGADNDPTGLNNHWVPAVTKFVAQFGGLTMNCEVHVVGDWMIPLLSGLKINSPFGYRIHPVYGDERFHTGIDLACTNGDPILAAQSGNVIFASENGWSNGYGLHVIINHGEITTLYAHMDSVAVGINKTVSQGDVIGTCGSTGTSTGNHLHFEIIRAGVKEDPMPYLSEYKPVDDE